jgi:hypothetical protein
MRGPFLFWNVWSKIGALRHGYCNASRFVVWGIDSNEETMMSTTPALQNEDHVRAVAYCLWLDEGMPHGRDEAHWLKAHELVNAEAPVAGIEKPKRAAAAVKKAAPRKRS